MDQSRRNDSSEAIPQSTEDARREPNDETSDSGSRDDLIARRAFQRFEERGREHGHDLEDWLEAEREVGNSRGE